MFFIGIFGIETKEKKIKDLSNLYCKSCKDEHNGQLIKTYTYFHFFFIPILKWNESYYILCDNCNAIYQISKEKGKGVERGEEVTYWDLKELKSHNIKRLCPWCHKESEDNFLFCPYCGRKLE
ncbi:zinc-ribbon family protein [Proteiniborus ethanoligenes]|uniref:Zinc-ribbon family protein n=1 Tax=Proteiniborus ethanoligenes TaxID=415015 RepID=A0A1H3K625_9FIRM|nr:zinc ribbon domain-containing protein [Proteiniborus ethanoligenes]TAH63056.1 MAG: zinc ribbon domain-containing protein [Gottschalkiaceae bacterium]SDY47175.1 zinc-ribbon family protein [Proteiniborus ethanoligenes]